MKLPDSLSWVTSLPGIENIFRWILGAVVAVLAATGMSSEQLPATPPLTSSASSAPTTKTTGVNTWTEVMDGACILNIEYLVDGAPVPGTMWIYVNGEPKWTFDKWSGPVKMGDHITGNFGDGDDPNRTDIDFYTTGC